MYHTLLKKSLKFYDEIIFWSGCICFAIRIPIICLRWRKLIIPVYGDAKRRSSGRIFISYPHTHDTHDRFL